MTHTIAILVSYDKWRVGTDYFISKQFPLVLSQACTIHKPQGGTLYLAVIDIGNSEKCCGIKLVSLSQVLELGHFLLKKFTIKLLAKINRSPKIGIIQAALQTLNEKFQVLHFLYWTGHLAVSSSQLLLTTLPLCCKWSFCQKCKEMNSKMSSTYTASLKWIATFMPNTLIWLVC